MTYIVAISWRLRSEMYEKPKASYYFSVLKLVSVFFSPNRYIQ
jgi:hypothetical protein